MAIIHFHRGSKPRPFTPPQTRQTAIFGVWLIIQNVVYIIFTGNTQNITTPYTLQIIRLGEMRISINRLLVFAVGVLTLVVLQQFMSRTMLGKAIRATSFDADAAALVGVNTGKVQMVAFGIGIALAGLAGALMSLIFAFDPDFGRSHLLKSFCIVVMGGLESFVGAAVGSLILALIESFSVPMGLPNALQDFVSFALLVVVLVAMPGGLTSLWTTKR